MHFEIKGNITQLCEGVNDGSTDAFMWETFTTKPYHDDGKKQGDNSETFVCLCASVCLCVFTPAYLHLCMFMSSVCACMWPLSASVSVSIHVTVHVPVRWYEDARKSMPTTCPHCLCLISSHSLSPSLTTHIQVLCAGWATLPRRGRASCSQRAKALLMKNSTRYAIVCLFLSRSCPIPTSSVRLAFVFLLEHICV